MSKVEFKEFVSKNPHLINQVTSGKTSWQKLYEIFDLYGESSTVWDNYKEIKTDLRTTTPLKDVYEPRPTYKYFED